MATLFVTEFSGRGVEAGGAAAPALLVPPLAEQTIAIGAASVQSAAFNARTTTVRVATDAACSIQFGANPTVTITKMRMAANSVEFFSVPAGQAFKVAVIANT